MGRTSDNNWRGEQAANAVRAAACSSSRAAEDMAKLIRDEFGGNATEKSVRDLFRRKWGTLSKLAHAIHEAE